MKRDEALKFLSEYIKSPNLIKHSLSVEAAMQFYARKLAQDEELWSITGILHDFDWEIHPTLEEHPSAGEPILRDAGINEEIIQAILGHADHTGVPRETLMAKALYACDEITGLVTAVALVRPSRSIHDLTAKSIKKKWKDKSFAAGANREEIESAAKEFGVDLWTEHIPNVIEAMKTISKELDLEGNISQENN